MKQEKDKLTAKKDFDATVFNTKHLSALESRNNDPLHINYKLYHILVDPMTYVNAFGKICKNNGATTKDVKTDQGMLLSFGLEQAQIIATKFKTRQYQWQSLRRTWIPKPDKSTKRPIDTPTQEDRIVQKAIRGILESIFEPEFRAFELKTSNKSTNYGFRPKKSCFQAAYNLQKIGRRCNVAIEGDIKGAYNNVNHNKLIGLLENRIKDRHFLKVILKMLEAGIMERDHFSHSLKGTPQGGIISPLLFNIYMFPLDKFIYEDILLQISDNKNKPKVTPNKSDYRLRMIIKRKVAKIKRLPRCKLKIKLIKELRILEFARERLKKNLIAKGFLDSTTLRGKSVRQYLAMSPYEIITKYNYVAMGICNYYRHVDKVSRLHFALYVLLYSCAATLAARSKTSLPKVFAEYGRFLTIKQIFFTSTREITRTVSMPTLKKLRDSGFFDRKYSSNSNFDYDPFKLYVNYRTKLKVFQECCRCESQDRVEMHHFNSVKTMNVQTKKNFINRQQLRNRLQMPLCHMCHSDVTYGQYDGESLIGFYNIYVAKL